MTSPLQRFDLDVKTGEVSITNRAGDVTTVPHKDLYQLVMTSSGDLSRYQSSAKGQIAKWAQEEAPKLSKEQVLAALFSGEWEVAP